MTEVILETIVGYDGAKATLNKGTLSFTTKDGLDRAMIDGMFYLEIPAGLDLNNVDLFASEFYKTKNGTVNDDYRGYRCENVDMPAPQGFFTREFDQIEQLIIEKEFWRLVYPNNIVSLGNEMQSIGIQIIKEVFTSISLPATIWDEASGFSFSGKGRCFLSFMHYRSSVRARGLNAHKDNGFISITRAVQPGLEILRQGQWIAMSPVEKCFIVNFGSSMEILTHKMGKKISAATHRIAEQKPSQGKERVAFGLFIDSSFDPTRCDGIFSYSESQGLHVEKNTMEFQNQYLQNVYSSDGGEGY